MPQLPLHEVKDCHRWQTEIKNYFNPFWLDFYCSSHCVCIGSTHAVEKKHIVWCEFLCRKLVHSQLAWRKALERSNLTSEKFAECAFVFPFCTKYVTFWMFCAAKKNRNSKGRAGRKSLKFEEKVIAREFVSSFVSSPCVFWCARSFYAISTIKFGQKRYLLIYSTDSNSFHRKGKKRIENLQHNWKPH